MKKTISLILITVCAVIIPMKVSAQGSGYAPDGVVMNKYVNPVVGSPYNFLIDLETFVTGGSETTSGAMVPSDIILVLDASGSMAETFGGSGTRMAALKSAANEFIQMISDVAMETGVTHKIGIIDFQNSAHVDRELTDVTNAANVNNLKQYISNYLSPSGGTSAHQAMYYADNMLSGRSVKTYVDPKDGKTKDRNQVVLFFTDGIPGEAEATYEEGGDIFGYASLGNSSAASRTIYYSNLMKNRGAIIFSIGIHPVCDPSADINFSFLKNSDIRGFGKEPVYATKSKAMNAYMHFVSSDYPYNSAVVENSNPYDVNDYIDTDRSNSNMEKFPRDKVENNGYYFSANNPNALKEVFQSIGSTIVKGGADYDLPAEGTTVVDVISADFMLPEGATGDDIGLYVAQCNGVTTNPDDTKTYSFSERVSAQTLFPNVNAVISNENRISVTGFDFSENYVGEDKVNGTSVIRGYKLIIEIPIQVAQGSSGGASLQTNAIGSGIFYDADGDGTSEQIAEFNYPSIKVPNIVIVKKGMKEGESALFRIQKIEESGNVVESPVQIVLTQREGTESVGVLKLVMPGRYKVEETDWSWAYDISGVTGTYTKEDSSKTTAEWNAIGFGDYSEGYSYPIPSTFGTETTANSITRNVNDFTEDHYGSSTGTLFIFTNSEKGTTPKHDEDVKGNKFNVLNVNGNWFSESKKL